CQRGGYRRRAPPTATTAAWSAPVAWIATYGAAVTRIWKVTGRLLASRLIWVIIAVDVYGINGAGVLSGIDVPTPKLRDRATQHSERMPHDPERQERCRLHL